MAYFEFINIFANLYAVSGASGVGFNTTLLPAPSAGAILCATRFRGKLKGVIQAITPAELSCSML